MTSAACLSALLALCSPSAAITLTITIIESVTFCFLVDWSVCQYISYITLLIFIKNSSRESNVLLSPKKLRSFSGSCDPEIQFLSAHNFHIITQQIIYAIYVMSHTYIVEFFRGYASFDFLKFNVLSVGFLHICIVNLGHRYFLYSQFPSLVFN